MTQEKKEELEVFMKRNGWNIGTFITVISAVFYMGYAKAEIRKDLDHVIEHVEDREIHSSFEKNSLLFVPRSELEKSLDAIVNMSKDNKAMLIRIEQRINK